MTSSTLALGIVFGIVLQLALYLGVVFWNHWQRYQLLRLQVADSTDTPAPSVSVDSADPAESATAPGWVGLRQLVVARKVFEDVSQSVCSFYLVPKDGGTLPPFKPGQFLTFGLDVPLPDGHTEPIVRCYSLSAAPVPDHYRISVKRVSAPPGQDVPPGRSSNFLHDHVSVGSRLEARAPGGHFYLDPGSAPVVLIAGGVGITPMLSMLDWCLQQQPGREIWMFYGVRNSDEAVLLPHLEAQAAAHPQFRLRVFFSDPRASDLASGPSRQSGRVDIRHLRMQLPLKPYDYYLCGPTPMMEDLVAALEEWGVPVSHIHFEAFGPASVKRRAPSPEVSGAPSPASDITVTFSRSGKQLRWDQGANNLLEFAESHGIAITSGCRAGGCGTCQTTVRSGEVFYRQAPDYDPEPGTCLMCVSAPKSSVTLEA